MTFFRKFPTAFSNSRRKIGGILNDTSVRLSNNSTITNNNALNVMLSNSRRFSSVGLSPKIKPMSTISVHIDRTYDKPGAAADILAIVKKHHLNIANLECKLHCFSYDGATLTIDLQNIHDTDDQITHLITEIRGLGGMRVDAVSPKPVPWFPTSVQELGSCIKDVIESDESGGLISEDHPGFNDATYIRRRHEIAEAANSFDYSLHSRPPRVEYTDEENLVWATVFNELKPLHEEFACDEFKSIFPRLEKEAGFTKDKIPQLADVSEFLQNETGFRMFPVCGLLSARDFLNCLAFRVFSSTQYIRHGGNPLYTPEPDVCHELIGHVPLLADPNFAEFSQKVGLASLGASDEEIMKLANIYWFTVEFGLVQSKNKDDGVKVMGAGILSSFGEMEWSAGKNPSEKCREMGGIAATHRTLLKPELCDFDPQLAAREVYPITTYQPKYFVGESILSVKNLISDYCDRMPKEFHPVYDPHSRRVTPNKNVVRMERSNDALVADQAKKQKEFFDNSRKAQENM